VVTLVALLFFKGSKMSDQIIHDVQNKVLRDNDHENFNIETSQYISPQFLDQLKQQRDNSLGQSEGEYMSVARVPVAVHEQWLREGFDMMQEPAHTIVARLKQQNLDGFLTTKKKV
jgi:hypothetical protein